MAQAQLGPKHQYVLTAAGPKIVPVPDQESKEEESPADYNAGGYLPVKVNDAFKDGRYRVLRKLGWGHFSTVWLVKDTETDRHSALKIVKSAGRYAETARDEIKLLSRVSQASPTHPGRDFVVSFLDSFSHVGPESSHICIVFEPLGENLLALIERHKKKGVPRPLVKVITNQILLGLSYLHDECDLVHTDIKPENIMIAIPDVESHIINELTLSPSPTSRRVGVPLPTKSRAGVSIPSHVGRATRRQVMIFDSQPLPSPGRASLSGGKSANNSFSTSTSGGKAASVNLMHMSRMASSSATGISGILPVANTGDASGSTALIHRPKLGEATQTTAPTSPSTSSTTSSSSLSNASAAASSTPATSVSHGSVFTSDLKNTVTVLDGASRPKTTEPIPLVRPAQNVDVSAELALAMSTSWNTEGPKEHAIASRPSPVTSSSRKSTAVSPSSTLPSGLKDTLSSSSPPLRKDPMTRLVGGTATPAPAVVIPASVSVSQTGSLVQADGSERSFIQPDTSTLVKPDVRPSLLTRTAPRDKPRCNPSTSTSRNDPSQLLNGSSGGAVSHTPLSSSTITPASVTPTPSSQPPSPVLPPLSVPSLVAMPLISVKIADLGNATPSKRHFTEDIQTRQYRSPEAILGRRDWDTRVDVWSLACMTFELLTAEYLFDPQGQGELFTKDDDHMAQIIELLGDFSIEAKMGGRYSRELFDHTGHLRYIKTLKPWPLKRVMMEKYLYNEADADALCAFIEPMLEADFRRRKPAREMVGHPWLAVIDEDGEVGEW